MPISDFEEIMEDLEDLTVIAERVKGTSGNYDRSRCNRFWPFGNPPSFLWNYGGQGRAQRSLSDEASQRNWIGTRAQRHRWPKDVQPVGRSAVGASGGVARSLQIHFGICSSLAPCHMPQLPFARPIRVSGCALNKQTISLNEVKVRLKKDGLLLN